MSSKIYEELADALELKLLKDQEVDRLDESEFILDPHQVFVERFFSPNHPDRDILLVNYQMGTGKTLAAVKLISNLIKRYSFIRKCQSGKSPGGDSLGQIHLPIPYVVGAWSTIEAFESEFFRPKFGVVTEAEYARLQLLLERKNFMGYAESTKILKKRLKNLYKAFSYQKLFNLYFKGSLALPSKTKNDILKAIDSKNIYINGEIEKDLSNSILVIDEAQLMYSRGGPNTYGVLLEHIMQNPNIENMTLVLLSGTFINSSPVELVYLANLLRPRGADEYKIPKYFSKEPISTHPTLSSYLIYRPRDTIEELLDAFRGRVASYSTPISKDYPTLHQIGEPHFKIGDMKFNWLRLSRCHASEDQWKEYSLVKSSSSKNESSSSSNNTDGGSLDLSGVGLDLGGVENEEGDDEESKARSYLTPSAEDMKKYNIRKVPGMDDVYQGDHLKLENLEKRFGIIPAMFLRRNLEIFKAGRREKILIYDRNTRKGGLFQHAEVLKTNGYVLEGSMPQSHSMCYECLNPYSSHKYKDFKDMPSRLQALSEPSTITLRKKYQKEPNGNKVNAITSHHFKPIIFTLMTGELENVDRSELLAKNQSLSNIDGEEGLTLGISSIGERAITIKECNHIYYMSSIPGIPLWKQIGSRIARRGTHTRFPHDRRRVDVVTMTLAPPKKAEHNGEVSRDEVRYLVREIEDKISTELWDRVISGSVNCPIVDHPDERSIFSSGHAPKCSWKLTHTPKYPLSPSAQLHYNKNFYSIDVNAVKYIIKFILRNETPIISLKSLKTLVTSNKVKKVPWNTSFVSDEAICEGIFTSVKEGVCHLIGTEVTKYISARSLEKDTIMIVGGEDRASGRDREPSTDPFLSPATLNSSQLRVDSIWKPLNVFVVGDSDVSGVFSAMSKRRGHRERINMLSAVISKPGVIESIYKDYVRKGIVYEILLKEGSIVWNGDLDNVQTFVQNRLNWIDGKYGKPIGVILGPYFFRDKGNEFERLNIPMNRSLDDMSGGSRSEISLIYSGGSELQPGKWHTRTRVKERAKGPVDDQRKAPRGMACPSIDRKVLEGYLKKLDGKAVIPPKKNNLCSLIEREILEKQLKGGKVRYVWSFFDKE